jgi:hypothetical protein
MEQGCYEIHIKGHMSADWSDWFDGLTVTNLDGGEALISGRIRDQAALHGVLARLYSLNLMLLGVRRVAPEVGEPVQCSPTASVCADTGDRYRAASAILLLGLPA